jgi:hypothetical protein
MRMRPASHKLLIVLAALAASSAAGFATRGWHGAFVWPAILCALGLVAAIAAFLLRLVLFAIGARGRIRRMHERMGALPTEQLRELMQTPTHPDSQFALAELMRRGLDARPSKEQLFGMLTSGNPTLCGHAMANLQVFYPELSLPEGVSNLDSPDMWKLHVEAFRREG